MEEITWTVTREDATRTLMPPQPLWSRFGDRGIVYDIKICPQMGSTTLIIKPFKWSKSIRWNKFKIWWLKNKKVLFG